MRHVAPGIDGHNGGMSEYRDSFSETGWTRLAKALSASFPIGRYFGVNVRVFWLTLIVMPLILVRTTEGMPFAQAATWIVACTLLLYFTIWTHEMGHIVAGWRYGIRTPLITLSPLGGLAHMSQGAPSPGKEMVISAAGPAVHLLWLALLWPLSYFLPTPTWTDESWIYWETYSLVGAFLTLNIFLLLFNLLPCFPMDGGRILRAFLAGRMHPNRATLIACKIGLIGGALFIVAGIVLWFVSDDLWGMILVVIGISNIGACRAEIQAAKHTAGPYQTADVLAPWQSDPEAWKSGDSSDAWKAEAGSGPSRRELRRAERSEAQAQRSAASEADQDAEMDRVLARISEVGMGGLTKAERKVLDDASKRRRQD